MWTLHSAALLLLASVTGAYVVPNPTGRYNVSVTIGPLADHARDEPHTANSAPRTLMLSVFEPALCISTVSVPYMPNKTAEFQGPFLQQILNTTLNVTPLFREARFPVCANHANTCQHEEDFPILLFSPGYSIPRLYYNYMASAIASEGFTVITIDHPGDANIITYPDNHTVINNDTVQGPENILAQLQPRIDDMSFLIDQLSNKTAMASLLPHRGPNPIPTDRIAVLGHSLGGIAAVLAAQEDSRLRGAINWDGNMLEIPSPRGISQPVLLMSRGILFDTWNATWPLLYGPKLWVDVANATHFTFSDGPTLFQAAGQSIEPYAELLGAIAPEEMVRILGGYTVSWMEGIFAGAGKGSWRDVQELKFKEVSTVRVGNL